MRSLRGHVSCMGQMDSLYEILTESAPVGCFQSSGSVSVLVCWGLFILDACAAELAGMVAMTLPWSVHCRLWTCSHEDLVTGEVGALHYCCFGLLMFTSRTGPFNVESSLLDRVVHAVDLGRYASYLCMGGTSDLTTVGVWLEPHLSFIYETGYSVRMPVRLSEDETEFDNMLRGMWSVPLGGIAATRPNVLRSMRRLAITNFVAGAKRAAHLGLTSTPSAALGYEGAAELG